MNTKQKQMLALGGVGIAGLFLLMPNERGKGGGELWQEPGAAPLGFIPKIFDTGSKPGGIGIGGTPKTAEINKIIKSLPTKETFTGFKSPFGNEQTPSYLVSPLEFFSVSDIPDIQAIPKKKMPVIKPLSESTIPVVVPEGKKEAPAIAKKIGISASQGVAQTLFPTFSFTLGGLGAILKYAGGRGKEVDTSVKTYESHGIPFAPTDYTTKKAAAARGDVGTWTQVKTYESHGAPYVGTDYTSKKAAAARQDVSTWTQVSTPGKTTTTKKTSSRQKAGKTSGTSRSYRGGKRVK